MTEPLPIRRHRGVVRWHQGPWLLSARGPHIARSEDGGNSWTPLCTVPLPPSGRVRGAFRWSARLFRAQTHHIVAVGANDLVVVAHRMVYHYDLEAGRWTRPATPLCGSRPLAMCVTPEGRVYYGEYSGSRERAPRRVLVSDDAGRTWDVAWTIRGIRHIHGVFHDSWTDALWVTTGDDDHEAGLWCTTDRFATLDQVVGGSQRVRVVQPLFTAGAVYFGSDAPAERNGIQRLDRRSGRVEVVHPVDGPVFYGCQAGDWLFFSTVCEPSRVNTDRHAVVWGSPGGEWWLRVACFAKDWLSARLFQYGQVLFPAGPGGYPWLCLSPLGTEGDQTSLCYDISQWAAADRPREAGGSKAVARP